MANTELAKLLNISMAQPEPVQPSLSQNDMLAQAIIGLAPILAGAALGGAEGGAAGAQAGLTGLSAIEKGRKEKEEKAEKQRVAQKERLTTALALSKEEREQAASKRLEQRQIEELGLKEREVAVKEDEGRRKAAKPTALTKGQETLDRVFAKEYSDYVASGGFSSVDKSINQLEGAITKLEDTPLTGPIRGKIPFKELFAPQLVEVQQDIESSIQESLKRILGAQFTEKEGANVLKRAFNPQLSPEVNIARAQGVLSELKEMAAAKEAAAQYFEENGTLTGFPGLGRMSELRGRIVGETKNQKQSPMPPGTATKEAFASDKPGFMGAEVIQNGVRYKWNESTGQYE